MQAQIIDKDFPVVAEATARLYGQRPTIALHKGFANYVCLKSLVDSTARILNMRNDQILWMVPGGWGARDAPSRG